MYKCRNSHLFVWPLPWLQLTKFYVHAKYCLWLLIQYGIDRAALKCYMWEKVQYTWNCAVLDGLLRLLLLHVRLLSITKKQIFILHICSKIEFQGGSISLKHHGWNFRAQPSSANYLANINMAYADAFRLVLLYPAKSFESLWFLLDKKS